METMDSISRRRSIRKFIDKEIPREIVEKILDSAIKAPSAKNRQPWKFIVITSKEEKSNMLEAVRAGIENEKNGDGLLPNSLFIFNTESSYLWNETSIENKFYHIANVQSIGAAIENMLLTATDIGIGSLWICDIFFAYRELSNYFNSQNELIAAVSFGYADEAPNLRPRKEFDDVVEWR